MQYNFDEEVLRYHTNSVKWDCGKVAAQWGTTERFDDETLSMFNADMDFRCAKPIQDALYKCVSHNIYGYTFTDPTATPEYYDAVINWFQKRHNWTIRPEEITHVNGTVDALYKAIKRFSSEGDGILITRPVYGPFSLIIEMAGRKIVNSPLVNTDGYYTIDFDDFEKKASDPHTKLFLLCNPHNPSGRIWTKEELSRLSELCRRNHVLIVSDEVHCDLVRIGNQYCPMALAADRDNLIVCSSASKTFNLAALQCTNVIISNEELRNQYLEMTAMDSINPFTINAVIAGYNEGEEWLDQLREYLDGTFDWILSFLKVRMPKVKCVKSEATYILWMDFRAYGLTPGEIHDKIFKNANVVLEDGGMFDPEGGQGFERICIATRRSIVQEAFERIAKEFEGI